MTHELRMQYFNSSWAELTAGGGKRYMKPQCNYAYPRSGDSNKPPNFQRLALYIPYLNFGEQEMKHDLSIHTGTELKRNDETIQSRRSRRLVHNRMTLDQYYYSAITNTGDRDKDQILSKFLELKYGSKMFSTAKTDKDKVRILVVDQLWIWVFDEKTIITATTEKPYSKLNEKGETISNEQPEILWHQSIMKNLVGQDTESRFQQPMSIPMFLEQVLGITTGFFEWPLVSSTTPLDVFRESIRIIANRETELFTKFQNALEDEEKHQPTSEKKSGHAVRFMQRNPYHIISEEAKLFTIIRDI